MYLIKINLRTYRACIPGQFSIEICKLYFLINEALNREICFKLDFLENEARCENILFYILNLFFHVQLCLLNTLHILRVFLKVSELNMKSWL